MPIVLDTNVVLSALLWRGTPHQLLIAIGKCSDIQLYSSTVLLEELAEVLARPSAARQLALLGKPWHEVLADYAEVVEPAEPGSVPRVVAGDVDDDQVIAAAVAARADLIVSGDRRHVPPLGRHQGIDIVAAAEALRRIAST